MHRRLAQLQIDSENGPLMSWASPRSWTGAQSGRQHEPERRYVIKTVAKYNIFYCGVKVLLIDPGLRGTTFLGAPNFKTIV